MTNLNTTYAGLKIDHPLIVSPSGLTKDVKGIQTYNQAGASAIIIKSLFEEQLLNDSMKEDHFHPEECDYLMQYHTVNYLKNIEECKKESSVPIIASINCITADSWVKYAKDIDRSGADALELSFMLHQYKECAPKTEFEKQYYKSQKTRFKSKIEIKTSANIEEDHLNIIDKIISETNIPIVVKIPPYITSLADFTHKLNHLGAKGLVLFNRPFTPNFDIDTKSILKKISLSDSSQIDHSIRWINLLHNEVDYDMSASTGFHNHIDCIKAIMAGASTVQLCSTLYKNGPKIITEILTNIKEWMNEHGYSSLNNLKGSLESHLDTNIYNRMQYVKLYYGLE